MERKGVVTAHGKPVTLIGPGLKVGDKAPDFTILDKELKEVRLKDFAGKIKLISVTPSLDTPVCNAQAGILNKEAAKLQDSVVIINVSMDLPFAIGRFCTTEGIDKMKTFSDHMGASFGAGFGVLIKELRLLSRAIFILDKDDIIRYIEIVPEVTHHPDYEKAIESVKSLAS